MAQTQLSRYDVLLVKAETTEGTEAVPVAADSLQLIAPAGYAVGAEVTNPRDGLVNERLSPAFPLPPSAKFTEITGAVLQRGFGTLYTATNKPEYGIVLRALGFSETGAFGIGTESYVYDTAEKQLTTVTAHYWRGLETNVYVQHKVFAGRAARASLRFPVGAPATGEFTLRGLYQAPTDTAVVAPSYQTATHPRFAATGSFSIGAFTTAVLKEVIVTVENTLAPRLSANATDGLASYVITGRRMTFSASFEGHRIADYNAFDKWVSAPQEALAIKLNNAVQYNRVKIDADKVTLFDPVTTSDENGVYLWGISGVISPEGTNRLKVTYD